MHPYEYEFSSGSKKKRRKMPMLQNKPFFPQDPALPIISFHEDIETAFSG
jgi:hypothetical protein